MNIYQIKSPVNSYNVVDLDVVKLAMALGDADLIRPLMTASYDNLSLNDLWTKTLECHYFGEARQQDYDISVFGTYLIFKMNAYHVVHDDLSQFGEFLPLNVEGVNMMLYNCLTFGQEQEELCETDYLEGLDNGLKTLVFDESDVDSKLIFKSKRQGAMKLYCSDKVKDIIELNKFKGVLFDTDLLTLF